MKQMLLNTFLDNIFLSARDKYKISRAALLEPEILGTLANDQIAYVLMAKMCRPGKVFLDVGAHIGSVISRVQHNDRTISIVAIEAVPEKAVNLRRKFPNAEIHQCAVGESEGEASFFIHTSRSGLSSLEQPIGASDETIREIKVPIRKLDDILPSGDIDVIKLLVEGAELSALRGSERILSKNRPSILFESAYMANNSLGYTQEALWQFLSERNYQILVPNRVAHDDDGLCEECFVESHLYPRRTTYYFAIPRERRVEIRDRARQILGVRVA